MVLQWFIYRFRIGAHTGALWDPFWRGSEAYPEVPGACIRECLYFWGGPTVGSLHDGSSYRRLHPGVSILLGGSYCGVLT